MLRKASHIALIFVLVSSLLVFSGCRRHAHENRAAFMVDYIIEVLDLNKTQQEQLNQYKEEIMEKALRLRTDRKVLREEIMVQLRADEIDKEQVKKTIAKGRAQMDEMINLVVDRFVEFYSTLTPEQKAKLVSKLEKFKQWHQHDF